MKVAFSLILSLALTLVAATSLALRAAEPTPVDELELAKQRIAAQELYDLKYKWTPGETLRYQVEQLATVETTVRGQTQVAKSRSVCTKIWTVGQPDAKGNVTFTHMVDDADMWQQVTGRAEVTYNSRKDEVAPPQYAPIAKSLRVPLATIHVNERGLVQSRENTDTIKQVLASNGQLLVPLPDRPIKINTTWNMPSEVPVRLTDGSVKQIKIRLLYKLERVAHGLATISLTTQVLTPVDDGAIKSQLVQRLSNGEIKFDLDAGRMVAQELNQDESVLAFSGADSNMQYLARFREKLIETPAAESEPTPATAKLPAAGPTLPK